MKRLLPVLLLLTPAALRADWKDLQPGMDARAVLHAIGAPLLMNRARAGGFESWTYDAGGCVVFVRNQLSYWQPPQPRAAVPRAATVMVKASASQPATVATPPRLTDPKPAPKSDAAPQHANLTSRQTA